MASEDQQSEKGSQQKVRLYERNQVAPSYFQQLRTYFENKFVYKRLRTELLQDINAARQKTIQKDPKSLKIEMRLLEEIFLFGVVNFSAFVFWRLRKRPLRVRVPAATGAGAATFLILSMFGEERMFHTACFADNIVGYYMRREFGNWLKDDHAYSASFRRINEKYEEDHFKFDVEQYEKQRLRALESLNSLK